MRRVLGLVSAIALSLLFPFVLRAAFPSVVTNTWSPAQSLTVARSGAATVMLQDGHLLITGGSNGSSSVASVDIVDTAGNITAGPPMNMARSQHTATVLEDGRVLVVGGVDVSGNPIGTAEIFDPSINAAQANPWTSTGPLVQARAGQTATLLQDGTVLIAGGMSGTQVLSTLELFDAASGSNGSFTMVSGTLSSPRAKHAAALLEDGRVVLVGGWDGTVIPPQPPATIGTPHALASTDIYDPSAQQVRAGPALNVARMSLTATTQLDGQVFVAGGNDGTQDLTSTETFDPFASSQPATFTLGKLSLTTPRSDHLAILLPHNGGTLLVGGSSNGTAIASAELYMPVYLSQSETATLTAVPNAMSAARVFASGSPLSDGSASSVNDGLLLVAGGSDASGKALSSTEYFGFAWVKTDALEYAPGTPVNITGGGFQPGETVTLHLQEVPYYDSPADMTAVVKADGTFSNSTFAPDSHDLNTAFFLTATGSASQYQAQTVFADNVQVNGAAITVENPACTAAQAVFTQGDTVCANVAVTTNGNGASATFYVVWFNPSSTIVASDAKTVSGSTAVSDTLPTTGPSAAGTWTVKACDASNCSTANGNKVWDSKTFTVREATTTALALTSGSSPSTYGGSLTFTATVSSGAGTPTGNLSFYDGGSCAAPGTLLSGPTALNASGKASFTTASLSAVASPHTILACYAGTGTGFGPSGLSLGQSVNPKALTALGTLSVPGSKIYDGTTGATISGSAALLGAETIGAGTSSDGKPFTGDAVSLSSTTPSSASYNSKDVATASTVTFNGLSLTGAASGNYTLTAPTQAATITPKALTYSGLTVPASKIYDGTTGAAVSGTAALQAAETAGAGSTSDGKPYAVDSVSLSGTATGTYNSKDVQTAATVTFGGESLTGTGSGNYTLATATQSATITPKALTYGGLTVAASKVYDATTNATVSGTAALQPAEAAGNGTTLDGKPYSVDSVTLTGTATATYDSKDVSTASKVTFGGLSLTGGGNTNYSLTAFTQAATITAKALTYSGLTVAASKIYDATTNATVSGSAALQPAEAAGNGTTLDGKPYSVDSVTLTGTATATYDSKDVVTASKVTFGGLSLTGGGSTNYSLTSSTQAATITAKALTYSGLTVAASKVYDATTNATVSGSAALQSAEAAGNGTTADGKPYSVDSVTLTGTATATYDSKDVVTASKVTFGGLSLTGGGSTNYSLTASTQAATITAKALTYSGLTVAASKVYDATTNATVSGSAALQSAEAAGAGSTSDGKPYSSDSVGLTGTATGTYNSKDVATANTVTFGGLSLTGADSGDYTLTAATQSATITAKALTYTGLTAPQSRIYDATTAATVSGSAALQTAEAAGSGSFSDGKPYSGDAVSLTGTATGTYNSKDVATANTVTFGGLSLTGADSGDYTVTAATQAATITAKALTITGLSANNKTYDGTMNATLAGNAALQAAETAGAGTTADGAPYSGDGVSLTGTAAGAFASKNAATGISVSVTGLSLSGAQMADYSLTALSLTANITPATLTAAIIGTPAKTYDGTTSAVLTATNYSLTGLVGTESFTVTQTAGAYNSPNVASATTITASLSPGDFTPGAGTLASNYSLPTTASGPGTISKADATIAVTPYTVTYDGNAHSATGTVTGVGGAALAGLDLSGTTHTNAGGYSTDKWTFTDATGNYNNANGTVADVINKANPTVSVTPYSVTYDGNPHTATGTATGVKGEALAGLDLSGTTHTNAGGYSTDKWTFTDATGNYNNANGTVADVINKANPTVSVTPYTVTYDGNAHTATGTATGVKGEALAGLDLSGTTHTNAGGYSTDKWTFTDATGNYNNASGTVNDVINKANPTVNVTPYTVTYDGNAHTATGTATGVKGEALAGLDLSGTTHTNAGTFANDAWTFTDSTGNYNNANGTVADVINKANPTVSVTPYTVTYDGNAHTATGSATGVKGEALAGLDLSGTAHTNAGSYDDNWAFTDTTGNYNNASGTVSDAIAKANAAITVSGYGVTYDGNPHTATGSALGVKGESLSGLDLSKTMRTNAGTTTDPWTFTDSTGNYNNASGTVDDVISKANPIVTVTPYSVTYDGSAHTARGTATGVKGEPLSGLDLTKTTRTNAGTTTDLWTFTDSTGNYNNASGTVEDVINKANATISVTAYSVTYSGTAHTASGNAKGVLNEDLSSELNLSGTTHTNAGTYSDTWSFTDVSGNYNNTSNTITDVIGKADAKITVSPYTVTYNGASHTATGTATGVLGEDLSSELSLGGTTHSGAGSYSDTWSFNDTTGNYNSTSNTVTDTINKADASFNVVGYSVTYDGNAHTATGSATGVNGETLSGLNLSGTTRTNAGTTTDSWSFVDTTGNYNNANGTVQDVISKANATVNVTGYAVSYDTTSHLATGTVTGVKGESLSGLDLSGTAHTNAGSYSDSWTFTDATGNYSNSTGTVLDTISKVDAKVTVTGYSATYDGTAHTATGTATGVGGVSVAGLSLGGTTHTNAGNYSDSWTFIDPAGNYNSQNGTVQDAIARANVTVMVTPYSVTYDGNAHTATGSVTGVGGAALTGLDLSGTTHTNAGVYTDTWTFTDTSGNYNNATGTTPDAIAKANATVSVTPYTVTYDGNAHTATGTVTGVKAEALSGLNLSGTTHTNPGAYTDNWTFTDATGNYNNASGTVKDAINYGFLGLEAPYAPPPTTFNVQRTMPIVWQYTNAKGVVINSAAANPVIQISGPYLCGGTDNAGDITVNDAGNSGYQYNSTTNTWQFNWQVKGNAPGCYNIYIINGQTGQASGPYPIAVVSH